MRVQKWLKTKSTKVLVTTAAILLAAGVLIAQPIVVSGTVRGGPDETLPSASIQLLAIADSSVVTSAETNINGIFFLADSARHSRYLLRASFVGYKTLYKEIVPSPDMDTLHAGTMSLKEMAIHLDEVTIVDRRDPIVIKEDTIEYRTDGFTALPHANVESLLRMIPGLEVDRGGNVSSEGESVTRIFVNGKEIFGSSVQAITRNLPAGAIDKIHVLNDKSEREQFSSSQSMSNAKAINLQLKKNYENTTFGTATLGYADEAYYTGDVKVNYFDERNQIVANVTSNNINNVDPNRPGDILGSSGQTDGLVTNHAAAINGFKNLSDRLSINGSVNTSSSNNVSRTYLTRQNFLPEGLGTFSDRSEYSAEMSAYQAVAGIQYKDSVNSLRLIASGNFSDLSSAGSSLRESQSPDAQNGYTGEQSLLSHKDNLSGDLLLFYGHKFRKKGRAITLEGKASLNKDAYQNESFNSTVFDDGNVEDSRRVTDQRNARRGYVGKLGYTEPLGKRQRLHLSYSLSDRVVETLLALSGTDEDIPIANGETSVITSGFQFQQVDLTYQLNGKTFTFSAGSEFQDTELSREGLLENVSFKQSYRNLLPHAALNVRLSDHAKLNFQYRTSVREPSVNELQPVESVVDPLNVYLPNINLRPEYSHDGRINFSTTDRKRKSFFFSAALRGAYVINPIRYAITIAEDMKRTTRFINTSASKSVGANVHVSVPLKGMNSSIKMGSAANYRSDLNLINEVENLQVQSDYGMNLDYNYAYKEVFSFRASGYVNITSSETPHLFFESQQFVRSGYIAELNMLFLRRISVSSIFDYSRHRNPIISFDESFPMLHLSVGLFLSEDKAAQLSFSANNMLDQRTSVMQSVNASYVEQRVNETVLGQFYMLSFSYRFNRAGI